MSPSEHYAFTGVDASLLGQNPSRWSLAPLFAVARPRNSKNVGMLEDNLLSLSYGRIVRRDINSSEGLLPESFETYQIVEAGDTVFRLTDLQNDQRSLRTALVTERGIITSAYLALEPTGVLPEFLAYLVRAYDLEKTFYRMGSGLRQSLKFEELRRLPIPLPPLEEQRSIAAFLDYETARIDELVREQERLATLLLERRSTLVIAAVSGQHSNAEMVDSRIPWLSKVARDWREVQIRRVAKLGTGHTPSRSRPDYWENCTIPWITTGEVSQLREDRIEYLCDTREKISEVGLANSSAVLHPAGTVFLSRTASAGFSGIMGLPMATSQDYVTWTCGDRLNPQYLLLCLRAMRSDLLGRLAMGSTHKTIYMPEIEQLMIPLPPIDEQSRIVERAWSELSRIDTALDLLTQRSGLLRERRSALITAAVTGQIDVRNWQPPDAELVPEVA